MSKRQKMIDALQSAIGEAEDYGLTIIKVSTQVADEIIDLLAEQEHEVSEWSNRSNRGEQYDRIWICTECRRIYHLPSIPYESGYKYCPSCGREMLPNDSPKVD